MTDRSCKLSLVQIMNLAKSLQWCTWYNCSTCGANKFRASVRKYLDRESLIVQLRELDENFVADSDNRGIMLILLSDVALNNYGFLSQALGNSPAGEFLRRAINIEKDRVRRHKDRLNNQYQQKAEREKLRAERNIWGAIKRRDYSAIESLLRRKPDRSLTNSQNQSLQSALDQMTNTSEML